MSFQVPWVNYNSDWDFDEKVTFTAHKRLNHISSSYSCSFKGWLSWLEGTGSVFLKNETIFLAHKMRALEKVSVPDSTPVAETTDTTSSKLFTGHSSKILCENFLLCAHFLITICSPPTTRRLQTVTCKTRRMKCKWCSRECRCFWALQTAMWALTQACLQFSSQILIHLHTYINAEVQKKLESLTHLSQLERRRGAPPRASQRNVTCWISATKARKNQSTS